MNSDIREYPKPARQREVYDAINRYKAETYTDVARITHLPLNTVSARMNELERNGWIERTGYRTVKGHRQSVYTVCNPRKEPAGIKPKYLPIKEKDARILYAMVDMTPDRFLKEYAKDFITDGDMYIRDCGDYTISYNLREDDLGLYYPKCDLRLWMIDGVDKYDENTIQVSNPCTSILFRIV